RCERKHYFRTGGVSISEHDRVASQRLQSGRGYPLPRVWVGSKVVKLPSNAPQMADLQCQHDDQSDQSDAKDSRSNSCDSSAVHVLSPYPVWVEGRNCNDSTVHSHLPSLPYAFWADGARPWRWSWGAGPHIEASRANSRSTPVATTSRATLGDLP